MSTVTIIDPFERNKKKMAIVSQLIQVITEYFPNHQICRPSSYRNSTNYYIGEPKIEKTLNNIVSVEFAVATPNPIETRKKILWMAIGEEEKPKVLGKVSVKFNQSEETVLSVTMEVFGLENKSSFLKLIPEFENGSLKHLGSLNYLKVESEDSKFLS